MILQVQDCESILLHLFIFSVYFHLFIWNSSASVVLCRRRELFVAPAVSLLNNNRAEFDTSKVSNYTDCIFLSKSFGSRASNKVGDWVSDWVHDFSPRASSVVGGCKRNEIWHKGRLGDEDDAWTLNTCKYTHSAEKSRDTTLNDEKYDMHYRDRGHPIDESMNDYT